MSSYIRNEIKEAGMWLKEVMCWFVRWIFRWTIRWGMMGLVLVLFVKGCSGIINLSMKADSALEKISRPASSSGQKSETAALAEPNGESDDQFKNHNSRIDGVVQSKSISMDARSTWSTFRSMVEDFRRWFRN